MESGDFGIFIDSLDGSVNNSRIGVRSGDAYIVVDISGNVIFQKGQLTGVGITTVDGMTRVHLPAYGIVIVMDPTQISVQVSDDFSMPYTRGLCGDLFGNMLLRDGTILSSSSDAVEVFLIEYSVLPGETFVRKTVRRECGKCIML